MASERLVECQDCGYRWESGADDPRCAKSDCGRSRNVEPVDDTVDEDSEEIDDTTGDMDPVEDEADDDLDEDPDEEGEGYTPAFEASTVRTDADRGSPTLDDEDEDDDSDEEADEDDEATEEEPEGEDEIPDITAEQLKPAIEATFGMAAVRRGQHWKLDDEEADQLAEGWTPVINHYAPVLLKEHALLATAAITSYSVLAPRLAKDKELAQLDELADEDTGTENAGTVREAVVEDAVEDEQPAEQTPSDNGAAPGGYASV